MACFIERFNDLISQRGTMARLSKATGLSTGLLSNYKNGKFEPSLPNSVLIADYFGVSLDWLAGRDGFDVDSHETPPLSLTSDERDLLGAYNMMNTVNKDRYRGLASTFVAASEVDR